MSIPYDLTSSRETILARFESAAANHFAANPAVGSIVLGVSEGEWEAVRTDSILEDITLYTSTEPSFPHVCFGAHDAGNSSCSFCHTTHFPAPLGSWEESDPHGEAIFAWSALCSDGESQSSGRSERRSPLAIARRRPGGVDLEFIGRVVRPWLDRNDVCRRREARGQPEPTRPPKAEPGHTPWSARERQMVEAIWRDPSSDVPRRLLVDWWLERDDERGRYGALSFAHQLDDAARRTRRALAAAHGRSWLGPLQRFISCAGAQFDRGPFVSSAVVHLESDDDLAALREVEEWAFVARIEFIGERQAFSHHMRGLSEVTGLRSAGLESLRTLERTLELERVGLAEPVEPAVWREIASVSGVRRLLIEHASPELFARIPLGPRLEEIQVWLQPTWDAPMAWSDDRVRTALDTFLPRLPVGTTLRIGYALWNNLHAGPVAVVTGGDTSLRLERHRFCSEGALAHARSVCEALSLSMK